MQDTPGDHVSARSVAPVRSEGAAQLAVIADDFTGALDAGVEFVRAGFATALLLRPPHPAVAVLVLSTDSRDGDVATAVARTLAAAALVPGHQLFKKIDSTMRGHVGAEIMALLGASGRARAVVCPAALEAGRVVVDGQLLVHGVPLDQSAFARDPRWPARTARLTDLLGVPATHLPLAVVRAGADALQEAIATAPTAVVTLDAVAADDLARISAAAIAGGWLPCGALGLARAWAAQLAPGQLTPVVAPPTASGRPLVIVAGSRHPQTHSQIERLLAAHKLACIEVAVHVADAPAPWPRLAAELGAGRSCVLRPAPVELADPRLQQALVQALGALTARVCRELRPGGLVIAGGETTAAVCHAAQTAGVHIGGELEVGVPWSIIRGGAGHGLALVTKAGGFGGEDALVRAYEALH